MTIQVHQANLDTVTINVRVLQVGSKKMTKSDKNSTKRAMRP